MAFALLDNPKPIVHLFTDHVIRATIRFVAVLAEIQHLQRSKDASERMEIGSVAMHTLPTRDYDPEIGDNTLTGIGRRNKRLTSLSTQPFRLFFFGFLAALLASSLSSCAVDNISTAPAVTQQLPATWTLTPSPMATTTATATPITPTTIPTELATIIPPKETQTLLPDVYAPIEKLDHFTTIEDIQPTMIDNQRGWAVGGTMLDPRHILFTEDGGWTWHEVTPPAMAPSGRFKARAAAYFLDESHAWVVFEDRYLNNHSPAPVLVWRTRDGGESWMPSQPLNLQGLDGFIVGQNKMIFTDTLNGWIFASVPVPPSGGDGRTTIFHTTDGGDVWQRLEFDSIGDGRLLNSIREEKFVLSTGGVGFAQVPDGLPPYVLWTQDSGQRWLKIELPLPDWAPDFFEVPRSSIGCLSEDSEMLPNGTALILISCRSTDALDFALYRSFDGAQTWEALAVPENDGLGILIDFLDDENGWIAGSSIYRTQDGGHTWQTIKRVGWDRFLSFQFVNQQTGWATVEQSVRKGVVTWAFVRTEDGGRTWTQLVPRVIAESN